MNRHKQIPAQEVGPSGMDMTPKDNLESWRGIHRFIERFPDDKWSEWKRIADNIVTSLEKVELAQEFRIGQSVHHIIFSTANYHGLVNSEPRVTVEIDQQKKSVRVAYSQANIWFNPPLDEQTYSETDAAIGVIQYLRRLWTETKPDHPFPRALKLE